MDAMWELLVFVLQASSGPVDVEDGPPAALSSVEVGQVVAAFVDACNSSGLEAITPLECSACSWIARCARLHGRAFSRSEGDEELPVRVRGLLGAAGRRGCRRTAI